MLIPQRVSDQTDNPPCRPYGWRQAGANGDALINLEQIYGKPKLEPEQELMLALLAGAIEDYRLGETAGRRYSQARCWFVCHEDHVFSFDNVCDELGFDAAAVRREVFAMEPDRPSVKTAMLDGTRKHRHVKTHFVNVRPGRSQR